MEPVAEPGSGGGNDETYDRASVDFEIDQDDY